MKKPLYSFIFFICTLVLYSQKIENVDFTVKDNNLLVTYDMAGCSPRESYDVKLMVICDGRSTEAVSVTGDVKKVSCGKHKTVIWNVLNDKTDLKGKTQVLVNIAHTYSTRISGGPSNAFLSMLLPGLGDHFVNNPNNYWYYISALYIGSAYYAISSKVQSSNSYMQYHQATDQTTMDATYKQANDKYQTYQIMLGVTGAIWLADVIYVTVKGFQNRKKQLNGVAFKEPAVKLYFTGSSNTMQVGLVKKF